MMKLYTAVGTKQQDSGGRFLVVSDTEEYVLTGTEPYVWSSLKWVFAEEGNISGRMRYLMKAARIHGDQGIGDAEFSYGLRRLITRKLIVSGDGEDREGAIEGLLRRSIIVPWGPSAADRSTAFWLCISYGYGIRRALHALSTAQLSDGERKVLNMLRGCGDITSHLKDMDSAEQRDFLRAVSGMIMKKVLTISSVKGD